MEFLDRPCYKDSGNADVRVVCLHHTAGREAGDYATLWGDAEVSIHYLIGKTGTVYYGVRLGKAAWHCYPSKWNGLENLNQYSIGIELSNLGDGNDPYTAEQLQALDEVLNSLIRPLYGELPIVRHRDISWFIGKTDPSDNFPWSNYQGGIRQVKERMTHTGAQLQEEDSMVRIMRFAPDNDKIWLVNFDQMTKRHIPDLNFLAWLKTLGYIEIKEVHPYGSYFVDVGAWASHDTSE